MYKDINYVYFLANGIIISIESRLDVCLLLDGSYQMQIETKFEAIGIEVLSPILLKKGQVVERVILRMA